ncbi:5db50bfa-4944-47fd-96a4-f1f99b7b98ec [Thermothielavioides terrestris]|jgi:hypothetical protein
MNRS